VKRHDLIRHLQQHGCVLIRDGARLERTFAIHPDYLDDDATTGAGEVNFADRGLQLSRGFRALKVWVTVQTFGLAALRACIQRHLALAGHAEARVRGRARPFQPCGPRDRVWSPCALNARAPTLSPATSRLTGPVTRTDDAYASATGK